MKQNEILKQYKILRYESMCLWHIQIMVGNSISVGHREHAGLRYVDELEKNIS